MTGYLSGPSPLVLFVPTGRDGVDLLLTKVTATGMLVFNHEVDTYNCTSLSAL